METAATGKRCAKCEKELPIGHSRSRCWSCNEEGRVDKTRRPTIAARERTVASRLGSETDLKMAAHTLGLAREKLTAIGANLSKHERERVQAEIESDLALVERTISGVVNRGAR